MGNIRSKLYRPFTLFNVEERAHKAISRDRKSVPSIPYKSVQKQLELAQKTTPDFLEKHNIKDKVLDDHLKSVYVTEQDKPAPVIPENIDRPLPQNRHLHLPFQFGVYEPETVRKGRCTLKQAFAILSKHHDDPKNYTAEKISAEYYLDQKVVGHILDYFKLFQVFDKTEYDVIMHSTGSKFQGVTGANFDRDVEKLEATGKKVNAQTWDKITTAIKGKVKK